MPVIRFIEGGPQQLSGVHTGLHAEIAGYQDSNYLEATKAKLAEHAIFAFASSFVQERPFSVYQGYKTTEKTHYVPCEVTDETTDDAVRSVRSLTNLVNSIKAIRPDKLSRKVIRSIVSIALQTEDSGIVFVDVNNQRIGHDGVDTEDITFEEAVRDYKEAEESGRVQQLEVARLVAKDDYNVLGRTVQPGKITPGDDYSYGNFTHHISLGYKDENGAYTPYVTVLAEPFTRLDTSDDSQSTSDAEELG